MQVVERDLSPEQSELDDPTLKKKAKAANKVRTSSCVLVISDILQEPKATKTKVKDKKMESAMSSPTLTKDEETIKRLKVCGLYMLSTGRLLNPSLYLISPLSSLVVYTKPG